MLQENFNRIRFQVAQIALVSGTNVLAYNYITRCHVSPYRRLCLSAAATREICSLIIGIIENLKPVPDQRLHRQCRTDSKGTRSPTSHELGQQRSRGQQCRPALQSTQPKTADKSR